MLYIILPLCVFWLLSLMLYHSESRKELALTSILFTIWMVFNVNLWGILFGVMIGAVGTMANKQRFPTWIFGCAAAFMVSAIVWTGLQATAVHRSQIIQWREEYPFESTRDRLEYETSHRPAADLELSENVATRLEESEGERAFNEREWALKKVHQQSYYNFVTQSGFGIMRMMTVRPRMIKLTAPASETRKETWGTLNIYGRYESSESHWEETHHLSEMDFLNPAKMGYIEDIDHVSGFASHYFSSHLDEHKSSTLKSAAPLKQTSDNGLEKKWQIKSLDLVGLLKQPLPIVYQTNNLPNMNELSNAQTRRLDDFEINALEELRLEKDFVIEEQVDLIRMLGSLRATVGCLQCHNVNRGELLGAFSYRITGLGIE